MGFCCGCVSASTRCEHSAPRHTPAHLGLRQTTRWNHPVLHRAACHRCDSGSTTGMGRRSWSKCTPHPPTGSGQCLRRRSHQLAAGQSSRKALVRAVVLPQRSLCNGMSACQDRRGRITPRELAEATRTAEGAHKQRQRPRECASTGPAPGHWTEDSSGGLLGAFADFGSPTVPFLSGADGRVRRAWRRLMLHLLRARKRREHPSWHGKTRCCTPCKAGPY